MSGPASTDPLGEPADRRRALRIIQALRQGNDRLEGARLFSVGRRELFRAAADQLEELEISEGAIVRWLKGRYGNGKTHLFARLIEIAHERNWVTSYVQVSARGQGTELHRFEEIYAAIIDNCMPRDLAGERDRATEPGRVQGWLWILDHWYRGLRALAGGRDVGDIPSFRLRDVIAQTMTAFQRRWGVHGSFAEALRHYALARADHDEGFAQLLLDWFKARDVHLQGQARVRLRDAGIREPITRRSSKEMLRALSVFLRYRGFGGMLILLDEVENILQEPATARRTGYTILRELIDNVDDRHGMTRTAFYISGTPDLFDGERGITENEALATRVLLRGDDGANPVAPVIDLTAFPLSHEDLHEMACRIATLHTIAGAWTPAASLELSMRAALVEEVERNPDLTPRMWVRIVVERLDRIRADGAR
jgi:hypothetical protein